MKIALMILIAIMPAVCSAEVRLLTLDQALAIAMEKNRDIEKAREYAGYVHGKYVEELAAALPQLSLNAAATLSKAEGQTAVGATSQRQFVRTAEVALSQPLYTWGKLSAALRVAEAGLKTADQQLRLYRQAAYRDVMIAYYDILLAKDLHRLAQENRAQKQRHHDEAKRKFSAGVATDYDVLAAAVATENTEPEVIRSENGVRLTREKLHFLLALRNEEVDVTGTLQAPSNDPTLPANYEEAIRIAGERRPELTDLRLRIGIYDELINIANADNKPRLDLKGAAGMHWTNLSDPGPARDISGLAWNAGIYLTFPFFDGFRTSGKVAQARSELKTKQIETSKLLDAINLEVRQAEFSWVEASKIHTALSGTVKQAERLVQMAEKGYEFGVKIRLEVDDAQLNLLQARNNLARAERDYGVAQTNYLWAIGKLGE